MNSSRRPDPPRAQRIRRPHLYRGRCITLVVVAVCIGWVTLVHPESVLGQNPPPNVQYTNKAVDLGLRSNLTVNPSTRAVEIQILLGNYVGRAGFNVPIAISYSSKVHRIKYEAYNPGHFTSSGGPVGDGYTIVSDRFAEFSSAGWTSTVGFPGFDYSAQNEKYDQFGVAVGPDGQCPSSPCLTVDRVLFRMPDGSTHELRSTDQPRFLNDPLNDNYYSVDGARMRYQRSTDTLFLADGSRYLFGQGKYVDRNGNTITINTDTLGRPITYPPMNGTGLNGGTPGDPVYTIPGVGGSLNYTFKWRYLDDPGVLTLAQPLQYIADSSCPVGTGSYNPHLFLSDPTATRTCIVNGGSIFRPVVLYQIVLPTGQAYTFTYNIYGEIDKVVLPTGGYERYEYGQFGPLTTNMAASYAQANRGVTRRYVSPSGLPADELPPWQYSGNGGSVSITAPDNSLTNLSLYTDPSMLGTFGYSLDQARAGRTSAEVFYSPPDENNIRHILRCHLSDWSVTGSNATSQFSSAQQYATRNARLTKEVEIIFDPAGGPALAKTLTHEYDLTYQFSTGVNETATNEYDYVVIDQTTAQTIGIASVPLGLLKRRTEKTYLDASNAAYRDRNLLGMVTSVTVKDGLANILAQSSITYDEGGQYAQLNDYGSVTNWTDPQTTYRGNPTTSSQWLNFNGSTLSTFPNGTYLTTHAQYDQCGSVRNSWDAKGNLSQMEYSSSYAYAYPTLSRSAVPDSSGIYGSTAPLVSTSIYDFNTGKVISTTDANNKTTSYDYTDYLSRLRQVTLPDTARVRYNYFDTPGDLYVQVLTDEDSSRSIETRKYFDGLGRPTRGFFFDGTPSTPWLVTDTYYDNMGRVSRVSNPYRASSPGASVPPTCSLCTTSAFDALGRIISVTTPDSAQVTTSYGALTSGGVFGTTVLVTDQTGKSRRSLTDSLGRLVRVDEPDVNSSLGDVSSPAQPTSYAYDVVGNLRLVTQGAQQRFFMYDSLGRLIRAKNPEQANFTPDTNGFPALTDTTSGISNSNWSTGYIYDANNNLTKRKDARDIVSSYDYDALNRSTTLDYSDTSINPDVTRMYDGATNGKGRVWQSYAGGAETPGSNVEHQKTLSYDEMGRPSVQQQRFKANGAWNQNIYETRRQYNLAGGVTQQTYPSGHFVTYNYDQAGRLGDKDSQNLAFTGNLGDNVTRTYSRGISYGPFGSVVQEQFGTDTAIYNKLAYNSRGQLAEIRESTTPNDSSWDRGKFVNWYSLGCGGAGCNSIDNNGNLRKQETFVPKGDGTSVSWYQQYDYDTLNRLQRVHEYTGNTAFDWQQEYVYDRYGNRRIEQDVTKTFGAGINKKDFTVNVANDNRLGVPAGQTGTMAYDNAGNLTTDTYSGSAVSRSYDAENRMTSETQANSYLAGSYTYNADGQRVRRTVGGQPSAVTTWQVYGFDGELLAEYAANDAAVSPQKEYGYRNGQLLITAEATPRTNVALSSNGATAVASSTNGSNVAANAINGERKGSGGVIWMDNTSGYSTADSIEINFNSSKTINEIDVVTRQDDLNNPVEPTLTQTFSLYGITAFDVQYWNGSSWVAIPNGNVTGNNKVWRQFSFSSITTSKIRVVVNAGADNAFSRVVEVEAYAAPPATNVALPANGGAATASSYYSDPTWGTYLPAYANDGSRRALNHAHWMDNTLSSFNGDWVEIDFSGDKAISEIDVVTQQDDYQNPVEPTLTQTFSLYGITAFEVQYWNGSSWVAIPNGNVTGNNKVWRLFSFSSITTSKIRVVVNAGADNAFSRVVEVEAWTTAISPTNINWLVTDQLGTPRMVFDKSSALANVKRHDYLPFGEEIPASVGLRNSNNNTLGYAMGDAVRQKFTQKERDIETALDYFGARYYASTQGRFTSPDPLLSSGKSLQPQSWNRYSYCLNEPLKYVDLKGLIWGTQDFEQDGHKYRRYKWFNGDKVGKGFTAFTPDKDGTVIALKGGGGARIYRNGGQETWPGPGGDGHFNNDGLNLAAGHLRGIANAATSVNPLAQAAVNLALDQVGGVDKDSDLYKKGDTIGSYTTAGALLFGPGAGAEEGTTTLYRAVKQPELDNILATGTYQVAKGATEGKYFFETAEDAASFGQKMFEKFPGEGPYTVTSAEVDRAVIQASVPIKAATEGSGLFISGKQLPLGPAKVP